MTQKQIEQTRKIVPTCSKAATKRWAIAVLLRYQAFVGILTEARRRSIFLANWLELLIGLKKQLKCMVGNSYGFFMIRNKF